ncbi:ABC transporter ATP-binding protein [Citrobacter freundii]|nr:ABC transporter ATP-binding protein [Citrobacter freundii]MBC6508498.1 ABC transporter ATP-binding protein [Citrobacter freundii]
MIHINNLTKSYQTPSGRHYVFRNLTLTLPADKNIALIGRNGAGKSTLLRMIAGADRPDSGEIITTRTISWPVGLSGGFQGSLTGRENVKFVARLYVRDVELKNIVRFVAEFAELGMYFDMPVSTYSSGMRSRLGFGLSMAFDFDYYLVDEVTSVGDARFRKKCDDMFNEKSMKSRFLMVSHSLHTLKSYCGSALLISDYSNVAYYDNISDAILKYNEYP